MKRRRLVTRWSFLKHGASAADAAGVAAVFPTIISSSAFGSDGKVAPSNRITMGCIGLGGRGTVNLRQFLKRPDVQIVALCDVDTGSHNYEAGSYRGLAPAQVAHRSITGAHLGNIAMITGRKIRWNPDKEQIIDDPGRQGTAGSRVPRTLDALGRLQRDGIQ